MKIHKIGCFLLPVLPLLTGCANHSSGKGPHDVLFAYGDGDGIYVLSGDGSVNHQVIGGPYYQPVLSPDKTKLACVHEKDFEITVFNLDPDFEVQGKPKGIRNFQAQPQDNLFSTVCCPVWSSDGQKIYFLNQNHLVVYDYGERKTTSLFDFPENQMGGQDDEGGNMTWSKDGASLDCMLSLGADQLAFWVFNPGSNQGNQVASANRSQLSDLKFPPEMPGDMVESLFGSVENPVLGPVSSPDGRYVFYLQKDGGFLASRWIEGYDRTTKEKFGVTTLTTSLYSK